MTTNLDALIAVLRKGDGNGCRQPTEAMRTAAEYLDELRAELRQERERADEAERRWHASVKRANQIVDSKIELAEDLSRAEDAIERVKRVVATSGALWGDELRINYGALSDALTEYDKQKGADRG